MHSTHPIGGQIGGLYETHLTVRDLDRSLDFYAGTLGLTLARRFPGRDAAFLWVGSPSQSMLGLWATGTAPMGLRLHFAFRMEEDAVLGLCGRLEQAGVQPLGFHGTPVAEPEVIGWMPCVTVYCKDPDGHSVEFLAMLGEEPDDGFGIAPYSQWRARLR